MKTSYTYDYRAGRIEPGSWDAVFVPKTLARPDIEPVCIFHGANSAGLATSDTAPWAASWPNVHRLAALLATRGIPVVGGYMGANTYANDAIASALPDSFGNKSLELAQEATGTTATKMHVMGLSMGAGVAARWASLNPAKAASVTGFIPMVSIAHLYQDNPSMLPAPYSFTQGIAQAWGLHHRAVVDAVVTSGSTTLTSATAAFSAADVGRQIVGNYAQAGIPKNTKIATRVNATTVTLDKAATASLSGYQIGIADPLPMGGTGGADLIGVHAPRLQSNGIRNRWYYASDDPYIYPADVVAMAAAAGGQAYEAGPFGHDDDVVAWARTQGGENFAGLINWMFPE